MGVNQIQVPQGAGLLRSKLVKPQLPGKLVPRQVFTVFAEKLATGMKLGLVNAPAGYGKSTLLSKGYDILTDQGVRCAWLTLDDDNDPLRLLTHMLSALNMLDSMEVHVDAEHVGADSKAVVDYLVADAVAGLEALDYRQALFIDDYHTISNPEVHGILERLVHHSPSNTVFVIAGRREPVGGELLIYHVNQLIRCSALVRSSVLKSGYKSSAY